MALTTLHLIYANTEENCVIDTVSQQHTKNRIVDLIYSPSVVFNPN